MSIDTKALAEKVECDDCGIKVRIRKDGTVPPHGWTRHGVKHDCPRSGKRYAFHMGTFCFSQQSKVWVAQCRCGEVWTHADYREAEGLWGRHNDEMRAQTSEVSA